MPITAAETNSDTGYRSTGILPAEDDLSKASLRRILPAVPASVRVARQLTLSYLGGRDETTEAIVLCVSELVTNAVKHSRSSAHGGTLTLDIYVGPTGVLVKVGDLGGSTAPQVRTDAGTDSESGRGLKLVATLADSWGSAMSSEGRVTWCRVTSLPSTHPSRA